MSQPDASAAQDVVRGPIPPAASGWAWGLCWLMFASTVLNYMDRQTVSLLREPIGAAFGITAEVDFGWVLAAFYLTYALFQVPAGWQWGTAVKDTDIVQPQKAAFKYILSVRIYPVYPPGKIEQQFIKCSF